VAAVARSVVACDPNPRVLEIAQRKFRDDRRVSVRAGSFGALPLEPESVDVVVSNLAYGWSEQRGGYGGLRELERVTRRGGQIRLVVGDQEATRRFLLDAGFDEHLVHETVRYAPIERADRAPVLHEFFARATIDGRLFAPLPLPVFVRVVA
jgi:ubiquinone/menaquinone biosynthesis C-methylase UbiE